MPTIPSLEALVGAHPEALRDIYGSGEPADATALGGLQHGSLLGLEPLAEAFVLTRPLVRTAARLSLFRGKRFESGGTAGRDELLGGSRFRFRCEVGPSIVDRRPTLVMSYDGHGNPWPISHRIDELRRVDDGIAIGPATLSPGRHENILFWWGLALA